MKKTCIIIAIVIISAYTICQSKANSANINTNGPTIDSILTSTKITAQSTYISESHDIVFHTSPYIDNEDMDSLIMHNDEKLIDSICARIAATDSLYRDHNRETRYVRLAIDQINPTILMTLATYRIGLYNSELDSISPFDYCFDEKLEQRIEKSKDDPFQKTDVKERFVYMWRVLLCFQPIDEKNLLNAYNRMKILNSATIE